MATAALGFDDSTVPQSSCVRSYITLNTGYIPVKFSVG
jgi:hypothetical protein